MNVESEDWAREFQSANISGGERWANEFQSTLRQQQAKHHQQTNSASAAENWANEFSSLPEQWANEFTQTHPQYANQFDSAWNESARVINNERNSEYVFKHPNPYDGNVNALQIGKGLAKTGVLSEATLALEAAVKQPEAQQSSIMEAWRLLGEAHAENDDDAQRPARCEKRTDSTRSTPKLLYNSPSVTRTNSRKQKLFNMPFRGFGNNRAWRI